MHENDKRKQEIENEVQKTINSLDDLEDIQASPGFFAAIESRIDTAGEVGKTLWLYRILFEYKLAPAILTIFIILNIATGFFIVSRQDNNAYDREASIQAFASQYSISGVSTFHNVYSDEE